MNKLHTSSNSFAMVKRYWFLYIFILPFAFIALAFGVLPIIQSIFISFFDSNTIFLEKEFVGFENYKAVFSDPQFYNSFVRTLIFTVISVPLNLILALALAQALSYKGIKKFQLPFKLAIFIPFITTDVVGAIVWKQFFNTNGAFNSMLVALGFDAHGWLTTGYLAFSVLIFVELWKHVGLYTVIFLTNYQYIDTEVYEAAYIDGANATQRYFNVTLPYLKPALTLNITYAVIQFLKTYTVCKIITFGGPNFSTNFLSYYAYQKYERLDYGQATAVATFLFLFIITVTVIGTKIGGKRREA